MEQVEVVRALANALLTHRAKLKEENIGFNLDEALDAWKAKTDKIGKLGKQVDQLSTAKKPKAVQQREVLVQEMETSRKELLEIQKNGVLQVVVMMQGLHSLFLTCQPHLQVLEKCCLDQLDQIATRYEAGQDVSKELRIFYDGTPDDLFSNFKTFPFHLGTLTINKGEKLFHLFKVVLCGDEEIAWKLLLTNDSQELKQLGRDAKGFETISAFWDDRQSLVLVFINLVIKLWQTTDANQSQNSILRVSLIDSANQYIAEGAKYDARCGIGFHPFHDKPLEQIRSWGWNHLGHACMIASWMIMQEQPSS